MKVLVTGATGLVGSNLKIAASSSAHEFIFVSSKDYDLTKTESCHSMYREVQPDSVIHLAARVGGIQDNIAHPADFFTQNIMINTNVIDCAHKNGVNRVISLLSTCIYPDMWDKPYVETDIHAGPPHSTHSSYAYAKRMLEVQTTAYNLQHGTNFCCVIPNNLYGPFDSFDLERCHVIPAVIKRMFQAKISGVSPVFWSDCTAIREFTFTPDLCQVLIGLLDKQFSGTFNVGSSQSVQIKKMIEVVQDLVGYNGEIYFDTSRPTGQSQRLSNTDKFSSLGLETVYTDLREGLKLTCEWYAGSHLNEL
jgi:GDP-L-fucose synthase